MYAESIAVPSLEAYGIYRKYFNPETTGQQILNISRIVIIVFGLFMGALAVLLDVISLTVLDGCTSSWEFALDQLWLLSGL